MKALNVQIRFTEPLLGTSSSDPEIHRNFVASKAADPDRAAEEVDAIAVDPDDPAQRGTTVFPKGEDGSPFLWDYQLKGFFKDACGMLRRATGGKSAGLKAYKKEIDGLVFPTPRRIALHLPEGTGITYCERPLRASTAQGERVALASSEQLPAGTWCEFTVQTLNDRLVPLILEWLTYGLVRGIGQWRNSGMGRFVCVVTDAQTGEVLLDNGAGA